MKKLLILFFAVILLITCKKVVESSVEQEKPITVSLEINGQQSEEVRILK